jgi:hypothetical protein
MKAVSPFPFSFVSIPCKAQKIKSAMRQAVAGGDTHSCKFYPVPA